jgi:hypothetical protein
MDAQTRRDAGTSALETRRYFAVKDLSSDDMRRNPYAFYEQMGSAGAVHYVPPPFNA